MNVAARKLSRGTIVVAVDRCKGCELCVRACPVDVLTMSEVTNANGFRFPLLAPGCTGCTACQQVCPDYVFEVYKYEEAIDELAAD